MNILFPRLIYDSYSSPFKSPVVCEDVLIEYDALSQDRVKKNCHYLNLEQYLSFEQKCPLKI